METRIKLDDTTLLCPVCRNNNLHQVAATVMFRKEDQEGTVTHCFSDESVIIKKSKEIPGRRDAIKIDFWCEHCQKDIIHTLMIMQHKGYTYIEWMEK